MDIYIQEIGTALKKEKEHFLVCTSNEKRPLAPDLVDSFIISDGCSLTTDALSLALENNIPLYLSDKYGKIYGKMWDTSYKTPAELQLKQLKVFSSKYGNIIAREWIIKKINNQKNHLKKLYSRKKIEFFNIEEKFNELVEKIKNINPEDKNFSNIIMGYEGNCSRIYYKEINNFLSSTWKFSKRTHQEAKDPYNIILNYLFGVLYSKIDHLLTIHGFNLNIGILHSNSVNQKSLLFDFIEPYRYIVLDTTFSLFSKKLINKNFFSKEDSRLTYDGKKIILAEFYKKFNKPLEFNGKNYKLDYIISIDIKNLVKDLMENEIYNKL